MRGGRDCRRGEVAGFVSLSLSLSILRLVFNATLELFPMTKKARLSLHGCLTIQAKQFLAPEHGR